MAKILILGADGYLGWPTAMMLSKKGHEVFVLNNCLKSCEINKVKYFNINNKNNKFECDVAIANADANLFSNVKSRKNFLFSHSIQNFEKFLKKNQLFSFLKYKPKVLCFSRYHLNNRSFLTSFYGKKLMNLPYKEFHIDQSSKSPYKNINYRDKYILISNIVKNRIGMCPIHRSFFRVAI